MLLLVSLACAQEPELVYDDKERLVMVDYPDGDDTSYEYYGDTDTVKTIMVGDETTYTYDREGNMISEAYASNPGLDRRYTYYPDGSLESITEGGITESYTYDSEGRVTATYVEMGESVVYELYDYYADGNLKSVETAGSYVEYEYDGDGNVVGETTTETVGGEEYTTEVRYEYDENGNIIGAVDSNGLEVLWEYEDVPYDCSAIQCADEDCTEYETITETCYYQRLVARAVGNTVEYLDYGGPEMAYGSNTVEGLYVPLEVYNDDGVLIEDDDFRYEYFEKGYMATDKETGERTWYYFDELDRVKRVEYGTGVSEEYLHSPTGDVIAVDRTVGDESTRYFLLEPGVMDSAVTESQLASMLEGSSLEMPDIEEVTAIDEGEAVEPGQMDYVLLAIIGLVVIIGIIIIQSRLRGVE